MLMPFQVVSVSVGQSLYDIVRVEGCFAAFVLMVLADRFAKDGLDESYKKTWDDLQTDLHRFFKCINFGTVKARIGLIHQILPAGQPGTGQGLLEILVSRLSKRISGYGEFWNCIQRL